MASLDFSRVPYFDAVGDPPSGARAPPRAASTDSEYRARVDEPTALIDVIERRQKERRRLVSCRSGSNTGATAFLSGRLDAVVRSRRPARLLPRFFLRSSTMRSFGHSRRVLFGAVWPWNFPHNSSPPSPPIAFRLTGTGTCERLKVKKPRTGIGPADLLNHLPVIA